MAEEAQYHYITARTSYWEDFWDQTTTETVPLLHVNDTLLHENKRWIVFGSGGRFYLRRAQKRRNLGKIFYSPFTPKAHGLVYRPVHPSMTPADIDAATYAYDDGTHWHFFHAKPEHHHEAEALAEALVVAQFQPHINDGMFKVLEATNALVKNRVMAKVGALNTFVDDVTAQVEAIGRLVLLGDYHRDPYDHQRKLAADAIKAVLEAWKKEGLTDVTVRERRSMVLSVANMAVTALTETPTVKTREQKRLEEEEAKRAAAEAADKAQTQTPTDSQGDGA